MRKTALTLIALLLGVSAALSQTTGIRRNIGLDSLIAIMQKRVPQKIYWNKDETGNLTFTINTANSNPKALAA